LTGRDFTNWRNPGRWTDDDGVAGRCVHAVAFAPNSDERILEEWAWEVVQKTVKSGEKR
jgi:hypothetical protein